MHQRMAAVIDFFALVKGFAIWHARYLRDNGAAFHPSRPRAAVGQMPTSSENSAEVSVAACHEELLVGPLAKQTRVAGLRSEAGRAALPTKSAGCSRSNKRRPPGGDVIGVSIRAWIFTLDVTTEGAPPGVREGEVRAPNAGTTYRLG
jgi:hypothetical protein